MRNRIIGNLVLCQFGSWAPTIFPKKKFHSIRFGIVYFLTTIELKLEKNIFNRYYCTLSSLYSIRPHFNEPFHLVWRFKLSVRSTKENNYELNYFKLWFSNKFLVHNKIYVVLDECFFFVFCFSFSARLNGASQF